MPQQDPPDFAGSDHRPDARFPRFRRLTGGAGYKRVFADPRRIGGSGFIVLYRTNGLPAARLGLAISKKCARRAVDRNRLKRIARESFRRHRRTLPGVDLVVLCSRGAPALSNQRLFDVLHRAWDIIGLSSGGTTPCAVS